MQPRPAAADPDAGLGGGHGVPAVRPLRLSAEAARPRAPEVGAGGQQLQRGRELQRSQHSRK